MTQTFLRPVDDLAPGEHACLVYDSDERREETLFRFFEDGLERGERLVYIAHAEDDSVAQRLRGRGAPDQIVVLAAEDCYLFDGAFDADRALAGFEEVLTETASLGFSALRAAGGPPVSITRNGTSHLLPPFERSVASLHSEGRVVSLCSYDARCVSPAALFGIIDAHPVVVYALGGDGRVEVRGEDCALEIAGWLDATTVGALIDPLSRAVRADGDVTMDLRDVNFVDIVALRLFVEAARELHSQGRQLTLVSVPEPAPRVLEMLGFADEEGLILQ